MRNHTARLGLIDHSNMYHLDEHKMLVELACSATLASAYSTQLFNKLTEVVAPGKKREDLSVVFIACGGYRISVDELLEYRSILKEVRDFEVLVGSEEVVVRKSED